MAHYGLKKEVYARKPRKSFSHLKKIYGERLDKFDHHIRVTEINGKPFSKEERALLKAKLKRETKKELKRKLVLLLLSLALTPISIFVLIYLLRNYFGF